MPYKLFPQDDEYITIKQGEVGSCYLLTSLDCILNSGSEGRNKIKNMFKETDEGVEVRIEKTRNSRQLKLQELTDRGYNYREDPGPPIADIVIVPHNKIHEIENPKEYSKKTGVRSNSLAVKIIEHISTFYFDAKSALHSTILGHDLMREDNKRFTEAEPLFVSNLLNIKGSKAKIDDVMRLKAMDPDKPVWMGMAWGESDAFNKRHEGHALRLKEIIPPVSPDDDYTFVLINPWDNTKTEQYTLQELKERDCRFHIFHTDPQKDALADKLMYSKKISPETGKEIFTQPDLLEQVLKLNMNDFFWEAKIKKLVTFHENDPAGFERLSNMTQQEANEIIEETITQLNNYQVVDVTLENYEAKQEELENIRINARAILAQSALNDSRNNEIKAAWHAKNVEINKAASKYEKRVKAEETVSHAIYNMDRMQFNFMEPLDIENPLKLVTYYQQLLNNLNIIRDDQRLRDAEDLLMDHPLVSRLQEDYVLKRQEIISNAVSVLLWQIENCPVSFRQDRSHRDRLHHAKLTAAVSSLCLYMQQDLQTNEEFKRIIFDAFLRKCDAIDSAFHASPVDKQSMMKAVLLDWQEDGQDPSSENHSGVKASRS